MTFPNMAQLRSNPVLIGAGFAVMQSMLFACMGMFIKIATTDGGHHPVEAMFYRSFICLAFAFVALILTQKLGKIRQANMRNQLVRGVVGTMGMVVTFIAFSMLPLTEVQSILFAAPIFVVALSYPVLKEKVGVYRITAALIGFCGVLMIVQPGAISNFHGGLVALSAAVCHAFIMLVLRLMGKSQDPLVTVFFFSLISTIIIIPAMPFYYTSPSASMLGVMCAIGAVTFFLQVCLTKSYTYADASIIAPITYLNMLWALLIDFFVWDFVPGMITLAGAAIIITSNFVIIIRESRKQKRPAPEISP